MNLKRSALLRELFLPLGLTATALCSSARADDLSGVYIGASAGRAPLETNNAAYQDELESEATSVGGAIKYKDSSLSKRSTAWWINTGYMVLPYVGIDLSYLHLGELRNQVSGTYTQSGHVESVYATTFLKSQGPALGLLFRLPLMENLDLNLRLADYYARTRLTETLTVLETTVTTHTANSSSLLAGLGVAYTIAGHWSAKIDYLRVNQAGNSTSVAKYNVNMAAIGASYTF